jgi:hypothetical protein
MQGLKIHCLVCSRDYILAVFYTHARSWQFRIVTPDGCTSGEEKIYYSADAAADAAKLLAQSLRSKRFAHYLITPTIPAISFATCKHF